MTGDRGSATVWVVAFCAVVLLVGGIGVARTSGVLARHRAEAAADLAALAGASRLGTGGAPCPAAREVAEANRAALTSCRIRAGPDGRVGLVTVTVALAVDLPLLGPGVVRASARAARLRRGAAPPR